MSDEELKRRHKRLGRDHIRAQVGEVEYGPVAEAVLELLVDIIVKCAVDGDLELGSPSMREHIVEVREAFKQAEDDPWITERSRVLMEIIIKFADAAKEKG